ncbi:protein nip100 [Anaeramoeba flamelloides]|uniref:Protein nip100 n=1 Tax=Anaeramoeba flamelloides TaxID=1746091 RepID=A0AAV7YF96_9EUKA|nr:protein nip100 [Anaeramoeba flamelloides]
MEFSFKKGSQVNVFDQQGIVKFIGDTQFSPVGRNNGSIQGVNYFQCKPNHGVFVRPSVVRIPEKTKYNENKDVSTKNDYPTEPIIKSQQLLRSHKFLVQGIVGQRLVLQKKRDQLLKVFEKFSNQTQKKKEEKEKVSGESEKQNEKTKKKKTEKLEKRNKKKKKRDRH